MPTNKKVTAILRDGATLRVETIGMLTPIIEVYVTQETRENYELRSASKDQAYGLYERYGHE